MSCNLAARQKKDYGLEPLTFDVAARILKTSVPALRLWMFEQMHPTPGQWSQWTSTNPNTWRALPEALVRLYLTYKEHEDNAQREQQEQHKEIDPAGRKPKPKKGGAQ